MKRLIYIPVAATMALYLVGTTGAVFEITRETLTGEYLAPYQYRVLFAYLFAPLAGALGEVAALWLFWFVALALFALLMDEWLREWAGEAQVGVWTLAALFLVLGFAWFQPNGLMWSLLEAIFWLAALLLIRSGRAWWLLPLTLVATLNRETAVFLPLLALLTTRRWRLAFGMGIVWAATYGAIRLYYGDVPVHVTLAQIWHLNQERLPWFLLGLALFGWLPLLAVRGYRYADPFLQRAAWAALPYLAAIAVFGIWREFRLFLPLLPLALPLVIAYLERDE